MGETGVRCDVSARCRRGGATGATITVVVCLLSLGGIVGAFLKNSSPYVTIAQARHLDATGLHLEGDVIQSSIRVLPTKQLITFNLRDANGEVVGVDYTGPMPDNFSQVHKLVAIGQMKAGAFASDRLLVKCPSKYEAKPTS
ncbi:MAG: cytochrome c maturation protein CcmE domain-containing protein [Fimbriimonadaceae bacterium]